MTVNLAKYASEMPANSWSNIDIGLFSIAVRSFDSRMFISYLSRHKVHVTLNVSEVPTSLWIKIYNFFNSYIFIFHWMSKKVGNEADINVLLDLFACSIFFLIFVLLLISSTL